MKTRKQIDLGAKVKDTITGFSGIVVCLSRWLNGCVRVTVQPQQLKKDGEPKESHTFDTEQLELMTGGVKLQTRPTGGPKPEPRRQPDPVR